MNFSKTQQEQYMKIVIQQVAIAVKEGNSPFAAILLDAKGTIAYQAHNTTRTDCNPTAHAEMNLIAKACRTLHTRDLSNYAIMTNAWSCSMCMSACIKAKITHFFFGAPSEEDMNPNVTIFDIESKTNLPLLMTTGILESKCQTQIQQARLLKQTIKIKGEM